MTIRKTLLRAFLLIGLVPALLLAVLAFMTARAAMKAQIVHSLATQADTVASNLDKIMFERLQNAATWSSLEVMQDMQVQDVDRRISNFLAKLQTGYGGVYRDIYAIDRDGKVLASSNPADIGKPAINRVDSNTIWQSTTLAGTSLTVSMPFSQQNGQTVAIRTPLRSQFSGESLGQLVLEVDWGKVESLLDQAAAEGRMIILLDQSGRGYAASGRLRDAGFLSNGVFAGWHSRIATETSWSELFGRAGPPLQDARVVVGQGHSTGFAGYGGGGLTTLIIESEAEALAPVRRMAVYSFAIISALALVTLFVAGKVSGAIARPIVALTALTRNFKLGQATAPGSSDGLVGEAGEIGALGAAFSEMTRDLNLAQHNLIRASKLAAVGEMSAVIIHEVRTPLGIMRSSAQMLKREPGLSGEARELADFIESETERLNRLVSSLLDSARPRPLNKAPVDVHGLIHEAGALLFAQVEKKHIAIVEKLEAKNATLSCDAAQLTQVLLNLILNAIQVLQPGGRIMLSTREEGDWFCIDVADDGPGIPAEERTRVFEAFFCKREGGVGLGLAIVQQIIAAHGGTIVAGTSELGGAVFSMRLLRLKPEVAGSGASIVSATH